LFSIKGVACRDEASYPGHHHPHGAAAEISGNSGATTGSSARRRSNRVFKSHDAILDPCCFAWNKLIGMRWKSRPWIKRLGISAMINETWYQLMVAGLVEERDSPSGFLKGPCKLLRNAHI
jgi:hypothetical protein